MIKIYSILISILLCTSSLFSQKEISHIGVLDFKMLKKTQKIFSENNINQYKNILQNSEAYIIERLLEYKNIEIIERARLNLIHRELELQKSENFMDGYIVEQGKNIGADYLIYGILNPDDKNLTLTLYSVRGKSVKSSRNILLKSNFFGSIKYKEKIQDAISEMINEIFPKKIPIVEIIKGGNKAKIVLAAGGTKNGFRESLKVVFYYNSFKVIGKDTLDRQISIGKGKIYEVENENFSQIRVIKGGKEISKLFNESKEILCKLKKD